MEDYHLVSAIKQGDNDAFKAIFKKYHDSLTGYARTFTKDHSSAQDISQKVFIILWEQRERLNETSSLKSYLHTIAYRTFVDEYRKGQRRKALFDELKEKALRSEIKEDEEVIDRKIERLQNIIAKLPEKCQEILVMNKFRGLKYDEIAKELNISKKTVEAQMRNAYIKIRESFENDPLMMFFLVQMFQDFKKK